MKTCTCIIKKINDIYELTVGNIVFQVGWNWIKIMERIDKPGYVMNKEVVEVSDPNIHRIYLYLNTIFQGLSREKAD